jgi:hypothetical protein
MSAPPVDLDVLHRRILATSAALHGARAALERCPSAENEAAVATAERRLNDLIDRLPRETTCS